MRSCARLLPALFLICITPAAFGQSALYKVGDAIEVFHLGEWKPATVINTNGRGEVLAEYTFISPHRDVFRPEAVRAAYESGAIARGRTWSDPSGSFKIKAALLEMNDTEVKLRKTDMTEVTVSLNKLSDGDKSFLKKFQKSLGLAGESGPKQMPVETFAGGSGFGTPVSYSWSHERVALEPDPLPAYVKLKQGGCGFPSENFFDRLGTVLPVGGPEQWLLAAVENDNPSDDLPTRLFWVSLAKQKVQKRQVLPPDEKLLDYHAPSHRILTFNELKESTFDDRGVLTVWEATPTDAKVTPIARWHSESSGHRLNEPWGRLIDGNLVLHRAEKQRYVVWDVSGKKAAYETTQESFFAPEVVLSGGRKYLFVPEDKGVRVLESATGKWVTELPAEDGASSVAVSEDGRQAAVLGRSTVTVWDLTNPAAAPRVYQAESIGTPFTSTLSWVGNDRLMGETMHGNVLFSLKNNLTLWQYEFDHNAVSKHWSGRIREIVDKHLVYAATAGTLSQRLLAVGAVQLPGPRVDEMEARLDRESLYVIRPGTAVRVEVNAGEHSQRVQQALEAKLLANGWTLAPDAQVVVTAEMKQGESQTVNYRLFGFGRPETTQSATFAPYISSLQIKIGSATAWHSSTRTGAPPIVRLREGDTAQAEVDKWQKPRPEFFDDVKIPAKILDPKYKNGLGTTLVGNRGLVPKN